MEDYSELLAQLPEYREARQLPVKEYYKYANELFNYRSNCLSPMAWMINKFYEWCKAMNCLQFGDTCKIPLHPLELKNMVSKVVTTTLPQSTLPPTTTSYIQMIRSLGHNNSCYDAIYCDSQSNAAYLHLLLGIIGLLFCLIGVLLTICVCPALNIAINRTGATLYLTIISICDCIYLSLFTVIVVIRYIPSSHRDQLEMYARFTAHLIPHGLPTLQMMELLAVWLTVALLVERFLYLKLGFHSKLISSRILSAKAIGVIVVLVVVYTIPKYLEFTLINYPIVGMMKVSYTSVGHTESFQNLLLHWLKVPIEMFLPYLAVAIFSVLNSIKFYDLMYKRRLTEANQNNISIVNGSMAVATNDIEKAAFKFPSLKIASNMPILSNGLKSLEDRENLNVIVALIIGFSMLALKVPKFILHALKSESYVDDESTKYFQSSTDFLDLIWVVLRPCIYMSIARHIRQAMLQIYCCNGGQARGRNGGVGGSGGYISGGGGNSGCSHPASEIVYVKSALSSDSSKTSNQCKMDDIAGKYVRATATTAINNTTPANATATTASSTDGTDVATQQQQDSSPLLTITNNNGAQSNEEEEEVQ